MPTGIQGWIKAGKPVARGASRGEPGKTLPRRVRGGSGISPGGEGG